jgi:predicted nucleic acid-binding protein
MLVVDASAVAELVLERPPAAEVERHMRASIGALHAPHLLDVEVLSALRRVVAIGEATSERARSAISDFLDLPIERHPHSLVVERIWELRESFTAYDGAYIALAEAFTEVRASLLTADAHLATAATSHTALDVIVAG